MLDRLDLWNHPEFAPAGIASSGAPAAGGKRGEGDMPSDGAGETEEGGGIVDTITGLFDSVEEEASAPASVLLEIDQENPRLMSENGEESVPVAPPQPQLDFDDVRDDLTREQSIALGRFRGRLSISPVRNTKLVKISFQSTNPVLAARVANTVGEQYITSYLDAKLEMTNKAQAWLNDRLSTLKERLDASEDRLIAFKRENGLVDVGGGVASLNEQQLLLLTTELAQARSELASASDVYRAVQGLDGDSELLETIPTIQADPLVQRVKIEQGQVQRQLDELLNRYGERHPRVVDAKSQLASLETSLDGHVRRVIGTIAKDYQLAQQRVASIEANMELGKSDIQAIGDKKFELDALEREVGTNQGIYDQFFNRMTEASSADGLETANARVSDYARPPVSPVKPNKQLIVALAALASLVLSMLMAFLYETMDDTIKSTNDVEGRLGLRLLGILPLVKGGLFNRARSSLPLNPAEIPDKKGTFSEAVNTVRTALCMDDGENQRQVIMITSSIPGEGKSTAAINIACSLSQLERVLLIDCDMRRPTVAKAAGLDKNVAGLGNLIAGTAGARECIVRGAFEGKVDILPSGPIPDQPLEFLSSERFREILGQLRKRYDRIVIDSAPTQAVSDALVLSRLCDAVVYVVKSHETSIDLVRRGVQRLAQVKAPLAGVVITQVDIDKITSYGGDYYYQGYYDYYGYTEKGGRKRPGTIRLSQEELMSIRKNGDIGDLNFDGVGVLRDRGGHASDDAGAMSDRGYATAGAYGDDGYADEGTRGEERERVASRRRVSNDLDIL